MSALPRIQHPSIPRVMCPRCGTQLRLSTIEPERQSAMSLRFQCDCGFEYKMAAAGAKESAYSPALGAAAS